MVRAAFLDKNGLKRGAWSPDEDVKLKAYIERYGHWNWRELPRFAGLARCGKSCRLRWINYLRPNVKRGNFTKEEKELIIKLHQEHGPKWSKLASHLPNRTDNDIKNYWHAHLKKQETRKASNSKELETRTSSSDQSQTSNSTSTIITPQNFESSLLAQDTASSSELLSNNISTSSTNIEPLCIVEWINVEDLLEGAEESGDDHRGFCAQPFEAAGNDLYLQNHEDVICLVDEEFVRPYPLFYDESVDLFYQVMQEYQNVVQQ